MACQLGVCPETVALWEKGQVSPLPRHHGAIVRFLGYDPAPAGDTPGSRLRALRRRLGLTQADLAARLHLDESTVMEFELGRRRVNAKAGQSITAFISEYGHP